MATRLIAVLAGACAGIALWYLAQAVVAVAQKRDTAEGGDICIQGELTDCVSFEQPPASDPPLSAACKDFLADSASNAALSECLHGLTRRARPQESAGDAI